MIGRDVSSRAIHVHRFAMIGAGTKIHIESGNGRKIWAISETGEADIPIIPGFEITSKHSLAGEIVQSRISELQTAEDHQDYAVLESFHYRGMDFSLNASSASEGKRKSVGGRRAVLILRVKLGTNWVSAGYIELQMPLMMAKPRHDAFDRPYRHPSLKISWQTWKKGGQQLVNRIVRIARVVVHPEMRGAGLSSLLIKASISFAKTRWHIGGKRPLFMEISAEMLRHIDFVSPCGFHFLGNTEGNKDRLLADLKSLRNGASGSAGIMSLQRRYFTLFENYRKSSGETFESLRARLSEILAKSEPWNAMSVDEWLALRPLIRSPIPYFMLGLDEYSDEFIESAKKTKEVKSVATRLKGRPDSLKVENLCLWSNYELPLAQHSRLVMNAFGVTTKRLTTRLVGPVSFEAHRGTTTFICGSSGCGKSLLLSKLDRAWRCNTVTSTGTVAPKSYSCGWLKPLPLSAPLFEYLADNHGAERAFDALSRVGLSEALLFLKPFEMLSRGQRYRAMLAELTLSDHDVWLIDEFCSDLDPLSAKLVAHRFRETVRRQNRIAVVAAANNSHFIAALKPAQVLTLNLNGAASLASWRDFVNGIFK